MFGGGIFGGGGGGGMYDFSNEFKSDTRASQDVGGVRFGDNIVGSPGAGGLSPVTLIILGVLAVILFVIWKRRA